MDLVACSTDGMILGVEHKLFRSGHRMAASKCEVPLASVAHRSLRLWMAIKIASSSHKCTPIGITNRTILESNRQSEGFIEQQSRVLDWSAKFAELNSIENVLCVFTRTIAGSSRCIVKRFSHIWY